MMITLLSMSHSTWAELTSFSGGYDHYCAVTDIGSLKCWGGNKAGQLGDGTLNDSGPTTPVDVMGMNTGIVAVSSRGRHSCALLETGQLKCWGANWAGQLGYDTGTANENSQTPMDIMGLDANVTAFSAGDKSTCAILDTGTLKCWGGNNYGMLGNGTTENSTTPTDVIGLSSGVVAVNVGEYNACAIINDGALKCWGSNAYGALGNGIETNTPETSTFTEPVDVVGLNNKVVEVSVGYGYVCALLDNNAIKCWGRNDRGQLGNGTNIDSLIPTNVIGLDNNIKSISAGFGTACVVLNNGEIKCWGAHLDSHTPVDMPVNGTAYSVAVGRGHICSLLETGNITCWWPEALAGHGASQDFNLPPVAVDNLSVALSTDIAAPVTKLMPIIAPDLPMQIVDADGAANAMKISAEYVGETLTSYCQSPKITSHVIDGRDNTNSSQIQVINGQHLGALGDILDSVINNSSAQNISFAVNCANGAHLATSLNNADLLAFSPPVYQTKYRIMSMTGLGQYNISVYEYRNSIAPESSTIIWRTKPIIVTEALTGEIAPLDINKLIANNAVGKFQWQHGEIVPIVVTATTLSHPVLLQKAQIFSLSDNTQVKAIPINHFPLDSDFTQVAVVLQAPDGRLSFLNATTRKTDERIPAGWAIVAITVEQPVALSATPETTPTGQVRVIWVRNKSITSETFMVVLPDGDLSGLNPSLEYLREATPQEAQSMTEAHQLQTSATGNIIPKPHLS
ncbi:hypothetical protein QUF61_17175 [Candidatus Venteria ishoeyi]|uniref:RCC1 domain-containing protein n=1 Tax=Candidatus Venteria ishoeyi TaxID=1899563 RepID=UPI0025A65FB0|nr:hypothetical protein [Candidatus Venteria ishoeyi]MDM8548225.1 hypothetical protein [Candidatus Venteria ishoeyi]